MAMHFNRPKSVLVILFIRLLILGQLCLFMSASIDTCADLISDGLWWPDLNLSIEGGFDLVNSIYLILYFIAAYIVYQLVLLLSITSHDQDMKFLAVTQFLKRFVVSFCKLLEILLLAQATLLRNLHQFFCFISNSFHLYQAQVSRAYLPFV